jgi:hypothetical protein
MLSCGASLVLGMAVARLNIGRYGYIDPTAHHYGRVSAILKGIGRPRNSLPARSPGDGTIVVYRNAEGK